MRVVDLITKKRDGGELTAEEINSLIQSYTRGDVPDSQMAAWLMAVLLRGMNRAEIAAVTQAMLESGEVLDLSDLPAPKVDKHSTGGVGDKTSLILAPIVAAAGLYVPMISGRGLGHSGGTLDKLESIRGFNVNLSLADFRRVLEKCGCALIGQTPEIAPADKKMYALRDVTGTVESQALICGSIMSKKLAEGIDALVLDVKTGTGAFMREDKDAVALAELLAGTGRAVGKKVVALITDMNEPLGRWVGNACEVRECIEMMQGKPCDERLREISVELAAWMLVLGGRAAGVEQGRTIAEEMLRSGKALGKFEEIIRAQGGDGGVCDDVRRLPQAKYKVNVNATVAGHVAAIDCRKVGVASCVIGGGRETKEDVIDPGVGIEIHRGLMEPVEKGQALATIYYNADARLDEARGLLDQAYRVEAGPPPGQRPALVKRVIQGNED
ncbi:MAG: thymidine phosphorylase [Candidatus Acidiferrales bacterium]